MTDVARQNEAHRRADPWYFAVAFGFSWSLAVALWVASRHGPINPLARTLMLTVYMFGPALGAVFAQRARGERVLRPLGVRFAPNRWWLVAWLAPLVYAAVAGVVSTLMPGASRAHGLEGLFEKLAPMVPPDQLGAVMDRMNAIPHGVYILLLVLEALVAGVSVNALAAFGEELGWRGFLHKELSGFWSRALIVGLVWGVWHAPIILQGQNYPQHPLWGVLMMIAWTVLLAPSFELVRERGRSVWATSILHGSLNASAGFAYLFVSGGTDLTVGVTGLAGMLVLVAVNLAIWLFRRRAATKPAARAPSQAQPAPG